MTKEFNLEDVRERIAKIVHKWAGYYLSEFPCSRKEEDESRQEIEDDIDSILSIPDIKEALELLKKVREDK